MLLFVIVGMLDAPAEGPYKVSHSTPTTCGAHTSHAAHMAVKSMSLSFFSKVPSMLVECRED